MYLQNRDLEGKEDYTASIDCYTKRNGYSVRCIQD
jgi:hypothetical protein